MLRLVVFVIGDWGCGGFMHKKEVITKRRPPQQKGGIISLKI
ncbi:MAG: hypothetical protein V8Q07_07865 [Acutalibacteraceae bacterium]